MKFIFFIIIIIFSLNVRADDNLFGKSIVCGAVEPELGEYYGKKPRIEAFEFLKNRELNHWFYFNDEKRIILANEQFRRDYIYKAELSRILVYYQTSTRQIINRENLEVIFVSQSNTVSQFQEGECKVVNSENLENEIKIVIEEITNKITAKNKI